MGKILFLCRLKLPSLDSKAILKSSVSSKKCTVLFVICTVPFCHLRMTYIEHRTQHFKANLTRDTCSNLIWWVQKTFLKIYASHTILRIKNLKTEAENGESRTHRGELQGSLSLIRHTTSFHHWNSINKTTRHCVSVISMFKWYCMFAGVVL